MGTYLNPGNSGFQSIIKEPYIDKTSLIELINQTIDTPSKLTCISRPRRFGKSFAAQMLCAYYDKSCDSKYLFDNLKISEQPDYPEHLNKYNVIYVDMTSFKPISNDYSDLTGKITDLIKKDISSEFHDTIDCDADLSSLLLDVVNVSGRKIIMIIDEWDAPIREARNIQQTYLEFLRMLFKNSGLTPKIFAAAYMTGILPIKRDGSQSAISDFKEYTMIDPGEFAGTVGFTEDEVIDICRKNDLDFKQMKEWYDGYHLESIGSIYNPNSVMRCAKTKKFASYWTQSSGVTGLIDLINLDFDGLMQTVTKLIGGDPVKVETLGFTNDPAECKSADDVLTLLIHYGYLSYDSENNTVSIPNLEILGEFSRAIRITKNQEAIRRVKESRQLIEDTILGNEEAVAAQIEKIHSEQSKLFYNSEQALRSVIKLAFFSACDEYAMFEEVPAGKGFADVIYVPKKGSLYPALVIELKWNKSAEGAIKQIKDKHYYDVLKPFADNIMLVGINYDKNAPFGDRKHTCKIEKA